jgi:hypothetical protein
MTYERLQTEIAARDDQVLSFNASVFIAAT